MKTIVKIEPAIPQMPVRKKVAAYARVSMETERLNHSLSAQISHYSELIQKHSDWQYVGVYADVDTFYGLIPKSPSTADFSVVHGLLFGLFGYRVLN